MRFEPVCFRKWVTIGCTSFFFQVATDAPSAVLNFDEMPPLEYRAIESGYGGLLRWNNFAVVNATNSVYASYLAGMVTAPDVAFNLGGNPASVSNSTPFSLGSAYFTTVHQSPMQIRVRGYTENTAVYDNTYWITGSIPALINFDSAEVDRVTFEPSPSSIFALDNLSFDFSFAILPRNREHGPGFESGTVSVFAPSGSVWSVSNTNAWVTITSTLNNTNNGTVTYTVSSNLTGLPRGGFIGIGAKTFSITQVPLGVGEGTVVAWGGNEVGQSTPCATHVVAIAAGYEHSLLLKEDGSVVACGEYWSASPPYHVPIIVPVELTNVIAVSGGDYHSLALKADGTVVAWGINTDGQTNVPPNLTNVVAIAAGARHSLALKADSTVVGWGTSGTNVPSGLTNVVAVAAGRGNSLVLTADGEVAAWGLAGSSPNPAALSNIVAIAAGDNGSGYGYISWAALQADGSVVAGSQFGNSLGPFFTQVVAIAASRGTDHHISLALMRNGTVAALPWGFNFYAGPPYYQPRVPAGLTNVVAIAAGDNHNLVLVGDAPPVLHASLVNPTWSASGFSVAVPTEYGRVYRMEYKNSLADTNWIGLYLVAGNGGLRTLTDPDAGGTQRFYRVRRW